MVEQVRWQRAAWLPVAAGLLWLWCAAQHGVIGFLVALVPGCPLLASGVSTLLYPGDARMKKVGFFPWPSDDKRSLYKARAKVGPRQVRNRDAKGNIRASALRAYWAVA